MNREVICWMDTEFSGPDPYRDTLLEVAALLTDTSGSVLSDSYHALLHVDDLPSVIAQANQTVQTMHERSGLWEDLWLGITKPIQTVEQELSGWLAEHTDPEDIKYLGGNTITLDRNHVQAAFPKFYAQLSYRSMDATSLAIFLRHHFNGGRNPVYHKTPRHRALSDVRDSVAEYQHYVALQQEMSKDHVRNR